jgi:uroporphyrinogen-III synthase
MPCPGGIDCELGGAGILVTRARHQADTLCDLIAGRGGRAIRFPAIEIADPPDPGRIRTLLSAIESYHILIFVSTNAVSRGLALLPGGRLPAQCSVAAVGRGSADALAAAGRGVDILPAERFDSEGLLETEELNTVEGLRVLIFRGRGGRPLLGDTLRLRGAIVDYAEVYQRKRPQLDPAPLLHRWDREVDLVTATSGEILDNLFALLGPEGRGCLRETPLLVISKRMQNRARQLDCQRVRLAEGADDASVMEAICRWAADRGGRR